MAGTNTVSMLDYLYACVDQPPTEWSRDHLNDVRYLLKIIEETDNALLVILDAKASPFHRQAALVKAGIWLRMPDADWVRGEGDTAP